MRVFAITRPSGDYYALEYDDHRDSVIIAAYGPLAYHELAADLADFDYDRELGTWLETQSAAVNERGNQVSLTVLDDHDVEQILEQRQ